MTKEIELETLRQQVNNEEEEKEQKAIMQVEKQGLAIMKHLKELQLAKKNLEQTEKDAKAKLLELCEKYGVTRIDNEYVKMSYVKGSESLSIDVAGIKAQDKELYDTLTEQYPKVTKRKATLRLVVK